jgi:hypothetical protein
MNSEKRIYEKLAAECEGMADKDWGYQWSVFASRLRSLAEEESECKEYYPCSNPDPLCFNCGKGEEDHAAEQERKKPEITFTKEQADEIKTQFSYVWIDGTAESGKKFYSWLSSHTL